VGGIWERRAGMLIRYYDFLKGRNGREMFCIFSVGFRFRFGRKGEKMTDGWVCPSICLRRRLQWLSTIYVYSRPDCGRGNLFFFHGGVMDGWHGGYGMYDEI